MRGAASCGDKVTAVVKTAMLKVTLALTLPPTTLAPTSTPAWAHVVTLSGLPASASSTATFTTFTGHTSQRPCLSCSQC
ncbi:hypothetical protein P7K49_010084 [Saguinus oedipus]|uniref:Secreted protein n=1 Tax=Saguinus oedipus TaxID=9490 RepID=A0ABQ9VLT9_SAGOE|nr:hypothetical protein P7K49_010084 [Saguinus oedipus]